MLELLFLSDSKAREKIWNKIKMKHDSGQGLLFWGFS